MKAATRQNLKQNEMKNTVNVFDATNDLAFKCLRKEVKNSMILKRER